MMLTLTICALILACAYLAATSLVDDLATRRIDGIKADLERTRRLDRTASTMLGRMETHDRHEVVPVETGGEVVAHLCVTCDKQLPATYVNRKRLRDDLDRDMAAIRVMQERIDRCEW